ncbi:helix-turn-helix domain-containing protein [Streptomyces sp. NPDC048564]|uniref:helix-turn-helix transcriptional regulator n=1 Tax=Streptomyces sp. NPDC048564 TaxID=3155760 RepID=UPI003446CA3A
MGTKSDSEWMSPEELAEFVGLPLSTIYGFNSQGDAPRRIRIGKHCRYRRADVEEWLDRHVVGGNDAA